MIINLIENMFSEAGMWDIKSLSTNKLQKDVWEYDIRNLSLCR